MLPVDFLIKMWYRTAEAVLCDDSFEASGHAAPEDHDVPPLEPGSMDSQTGKILTIQRALRPEIEETGRKTEIIHPPYRRVNQRISPDLRAGAEDNSLKNRCGAGLRT